MSRDVPEVRAVLDKLSERHGDTLSTRFCEQLRYPRVSNLRFRPAPKHLAGTPIIHCGRGRHGRGKVMSFTNANTYQIAEWSDTTSSNVVVASEMET